jgi:hypothetical protein
VKKDDAVKCTAILQTSKNMDNPDMKKPYNHQPDENAITIAKCRHHEKKSQINANAQLPDDAKAYIPSSDTCKRVLRRFCAQNRPREPQTLQELEIDGAWPMTTGDNPQPFLLHDNGSDATERVVIFAKEHHIQKLADSNVWCMDGNFAMAPSIFMQLYVIQGRVSGVFVPLQRKTRYESMFCVLEEHGCDPSVVIIDFERSVDLALLAVYGPQVQIQYCFYHLTQSTWRQIQSLGLTNMYKDDEFRLFCGQLDALAFLLLWEVHEGMQYIKQTMPEAAEPLVDYFDRTYVSGRL